MKKSIFILSFLTLGIVSCSSDDNAPEKGTDPIKEEPTIVEKATMKPNVGGPNQPNQVFIDLSTNQQIAIKRDSWDLGFATGSDFRVIINGSVKMAVKKLETTNIDLVQEEDATVAVGFSTSANLGYVDNPTGVLKGSNPGEGTAIDEISATAENNYVYLVNLGFEVGTTTPDLGSAALDGAKRGWKKIRITRQGNDYVVQYADLKDTTHKTVTVSKNADYNFTYLSLKNGQKVDVQPRKTQWDLSFTSFTNYIPYQSNMITYHFADFITSNIYNGTKVYMIQAEAGKGEVEYEKFTKAQVDESKFAISLTEQRVIGDTWRKGGSSSSAPSIKDDRFYVVKDADGNVFKLLFRALTNDAGERGYPVFEYQLLK